MKKKEIMNFLYAELGKNKNQLTKIEKALYMTAPENMESKEAQTLIQMQKDFQKHIWNLQWCIGNMK